MNLEQSKIPFNREMFKKNLEILVDKYASTLDNFNHDSENDIEQEGALKREIINSEMEIINFIVSELKKGAEKLEILDSFSEVIYNISLRRNKPHEGDYVIGYATEAHLLKGILLAMK